MGADTLLELIDDLYSGVRDPDRTARFLAGSAHALGCHVAGLTVRNDVEGTGSAAHMAGDGANEQAAERYAREYSASGDNLWYLRSRGAMRTGAVINSDDWAGSSEIRRTRYYATFLRTLDIEHSIAICAYEQPGRSVVVSYGRSGRAGAVDSTTLRLAGLLAPHVVNAYALTHERSRQLLESARRPVVSFALDPELRWTNPDADSIALARGGWLRARPGSTLQPVNAASRGAWAEHCRGALRSGAIPPAPVALYDAAGSLVALMALRQIGVRVASGTARYACQVRMLSLQNHDDLQRALSSAFGLTPAETRLVADLRLTRDLGTTAERLKLSIKGSRTRLQSIYAKTGTGRQNALLALLDAMDEMLR